MHNVIFFSFSKYFFTKFVKITFYSDFKKIIEKLKTRSQIKKKIPKILFSYLKIENLKRVKISVYSVKKISNNTRRFYAMRFLSSVWFEGNRCFLSQYFHLNHPKTQGVRQFRTRKR